MKHHFLLRSSSQADFGPVRNESMPLMFHSRCLFRKYDKPGLLLPFIPHQWVNIIIVIGYVNQNCDNDWRTEPLCSPSDDNGCTVCYQTTTNIISTNLHLILSINQLQPDKKSYKPAKHFQFVRIKILKYHKNTFILAWLRKKSLFIK